MELNQHQPFINSFTVNKEHSQITLDSKTSHNFNIKGYLTAFTITFIKIVLDRFTIQLTICRILITECATFEEELLTFKGLENQLIP